MAQKSRISHVACLFFAATIVCLALSNTACFAQTAQPSLDAQVEDFNRHHARDGFSNSVSVDKSARADEEYRLGISLYQRWQAEHVPKDLSMAEMFFSRSAAAGNESAKLKLEEVQAVATAPPIIKHIVPLNKKRPFFERISTVEGWAAEFGQTGVWFMIAGGPVLLVCYVISLISHIVLGRYFIRKKMPWGLAVLICDLTSTLGTVLLTMIYLFMRYPSNPILGFSIVGMFYLAPIAAFASLLVLGVMLWPGTPNRQKTGKRFLK